MIGLFYNLKLPESLDFAGVFQRVNELFDYCCSLRFASIDPRLEHYRKLPEKEPVPKPKEAEGQPLYFFLSPERGPLGIVTTHIQVREHEPLMPGESRTYRDDDKISVRSLEAYYFSLLPGAGGIMGSSFGVAKWPEVLAYKHPDDPDGPTLTKELPDHLSGWSGGGAFIAADCANPKHGGVANFLSAYLSMIAAFDAARELGFEVSVSDTSGFWDERDVDALLETLGTSLVEEAKAVGRLKDETGAIICNDIVTRPDFEHLESGRLPNLREVWDEDLARLIELTTDRPNQDWRSSAGGQA